MTKNAKQLNIKTVISEALKKVEGNKESALCPYLPSGGVGYMHHFTFAKMKENDPSKLSDLIQKYILTGKPKRLPSAPRARYNQSAKISLTNNDLDRLMELARNAGDDRLTAKLARPKSFARIKQEFLASVRANQADEQLWESYRTALTKQHKSAA